MASIELEKLTKRYQDGTEAVKGIDLQIEDGEFMILVGPSGCGKTTALRMLAGLEDISDGVARIGDRVVNEVAPKDRDIAMVFQNYALYPHMTVRQNIGFALKLSKLRKGEIANRVEDTARILDLTAHLDRRPGKLSGGQRQRVAIGRAIVRAPQAFLMDEPLSNLDAKLRVAMRVELARLQSSLGTTTVYVTHDQTEAMTLGDRLAVMRGGLIQQVGTPGFLYEEPANVFVAGFIGSPPMSFLTAELGHESLRFSFGEVSLPAALRARLSPSASRGKVIVGLRPEDFDDAALTSDRGDTMRIQPKIDVIESMGSEVFAYFTVADRTDGIDKLAYSDEDRVTRLDAPDGSAAVVARLDARSRVSAGAEAQLLFRTAGLRLFDVETGKSLLEPRPSTSPNGFEPAPISAPA